MFWRAVVRQEPNSPRPSVFDRSQSHHVGGSIEGVSFSGHERNNLILSAGSTRFDDVSGISGFDDPADGRAMGILDYDRDGWTDLAVVNANAPTFQLYRNRIGELVQEPRRILALRFRGANDSASPDPQRSNRDGYGARVEIDLGGATLVRELRAGEGFSSQSSRTLVVGLGEGVEAADLRVRWPSGKVQTLENAPADALVTAYEDPADSPDGSGFELAPYRIQGLAARARAAARPGAPPPRLELASNGSPDAKLRVLTTMATWCETCKGELPQIAQLRKAFSAQELALVGVPVDEHDDARKLATYREQLAPAYELLDPLPEAQRSAVQKVVIDALRVDALPATIVTDGKGRVLGTSAGVPSVSELRAYLERAS